jgi:hypothetical protein
MKMLGEWNWYLPRWLEWLPQFGGDWSTEPEPKQPGRDRSRERRGEPSPALESE